MSIPEIDPEWQSRRQVETFLRPRAVKRNHTWRKLRKTLLAIAKGLGVMLAFVLPGVFGVLVGFWMFGEDGAFLGAITPYLVFCVLGVAYAIGSLE